MASSSAKIAVRSRPLALNVSHSHRRTPSDVGTRTSNAYGPSSRVAHSSERLHRLSALGQDHQARSSQRHG